MKKYLHDRECISCSEYEYTDRTNRIKCQTQPKQAELYLVILKIKIDLLIVQIATNIYQKESNQ